MKRKNILFGITASIAAYKTCDLISLLKRDGHSVKAIMTKHSLKLIGPITIQSLTGNPVYTEMFDYIAPGDEDIEHISLAKWCDLLAIVPATGNIIGKIANGIADDLLSTTTMALPRKKPVVIAPAMNTNMWLNRFVQKNVGILKEESIKIRGRVLPKYTIIEPKTGRLACGDEGVGALANAEDIHKKIREILKSL